MEKCTNMDASDDSDDIDEIVDSVNHSSNDNLETAMQKVSRPITLLHFVTRLDGCQTLSNMSRSQDLHSKAIDFYINGSNSIDITQIIDNSDNRKVNNNDDHNVEYPIGISTTIEQNRVEHDLNDIHRKALEYDQQQIKGIQFANAGDGNLKVINNHTVTSNTCTLF